MIGLKCTIYRYKLDLSKGYYGAAGTSLRIGLFGCNAVPEKVDFVLKAVQDGIKYLQSQSKILKSDDDVMQCYQKLV